MAVQAYTVALQGMEAREVEVQCHLAAGLPAFTLVGLPDKAVAESKERVRAALDPILDDLDDVLGQRLGCLRHR